MDGGVEFSPRSAESGELLEVGEIIDEEGETDVGEIFDESLVTIDSTDMFNESVDWEKKYEEVRTAQEKFWKVANGDLPSIYRNRTIWTGVPSPELTEPCLNVWNTVPTARTASMGFISLLIHENTHLYFNGKENSQLATDFSSVENAALSLLKFLNEIVPTCNTDLTYEILRWCCTTGSELSEQNKGRLIADNSRSPKQLFDLFITVPSIKELIHLLNKVVKTLLEKNPNKCMTALFDASKHGSDFNWIWQHIVLSYPEAIVNHLFVVGSREFHDYVDLIKKKDKEQVHPAVLSSILDEYNRKFSFLSEVFNFISHKGNPDLKILVSRMIQESLDSEETEPRNLNMVYFFKLVTCSVETLRILVSQYLHLANPMNFIRGIQQVISVDKKLVLPTLSYSEFSGQMLSAIDSVSLGIVFKVMMYIAFEDKIFQGLKDFPSEVVIIIKNAAFIAVETIINSILNIAHSNEVSATFDDPPLRAFAFDDELQFVIDIAVNRLNATPILLRYLHSLTLKLGELKGAEIVARILFVCEDKTKLSIIPAFLYTICPFFPGIMQVVYRNLFALRSSFLSGRNLEDIDIFIVANLQVILSWEVTSEENSPHKHFGFNPGFYLGELLSGLLSNVLEFIQENKAKNCQDKIRAILQPLIKLLTSLSPSKVSQKNKQGQIRSILFTGRYAYKTAIQLAALLKYTLGDTTSKHSEDLKTFRRLSAAILDFYSNYCNALMDSFYILFVQSYAIGCLQESKIIFGEDVNLNPWAEPSVEKDLDLIDDDYSFLKAIENMSVHKKVVQLAHSGIIGRGARKLHPVSNASVDQYFRREVFIDSIRNFCIGENLSMSINNCKVLANLLTELFCQDSLSAEMLFGDWELEKETIARYLEILQKYNGSSVCRGLLSIVSEVKPCLWYCLPILKAILASIINRLENAVYKNSAPSASDLDQLDSLILILRQSDLIPQRFEVLLDILPHVSNYEGFLLLSDLWKYFQRRTVTSATVNQAVISMQKNDGCDALAGNFDGDFDIYRLVIQKHISKLGYLFPVIFLPNKPS